MDDKHFYPPCSQCGGKKLKLGYCMNCYSFEVPTYNRSQEHELAYGFKGDKQQKRDSYNDYLKKVVK